MKENYSLFLVDDDPDDHLFFQQALKKINISCTLTSVYSGVELLDALTKRDNYNSETTPNPNFIVLDLNMPLLSGFQVLEKLKSNINLSSIPVFVMSTSQNKDDAKRVLDMGAISFYTKPNSGLKLQQIIAEMLISL